MPRLAWKSTQGIEGMPCYGTRRRRKLEGTISIFMYYMKCHKQIQIYIYIYIQNRMIGVANYKK